MISILSPKLRKSSPFRIARDDTSCESSGSSMHEELRVSKENPETSCVREINDFFCNFGVRLPEEKVFRYACFHRFSAEEAIEAIGEDKYNPYLQLNMEDLQDQFASSSLFPIPQLRTRKNSEVVYMRPSRFIRQHGGIEKVIESLCYVFNDLSQTEEQCRNGVTVIANMQDISEEDFSKQHFKKLIEALQGHMVPTRVGGFLIVSPPSSFGKIWKWMKSAMSRDFARRVHLIKQDRLHEFLMDGYELHIPDDFCQGLARASEIVEDYVDLKILQEQQPQ